MDEFMKEALDVVKAQAKVRVMTGDEIMGMVLSLAQKMKALCAEREGVEMEMPRPDAKGAIREKSITCLECGKNFKVLTKRHLASHNITPEEYREKYGMKKGSPLVCKSLQRERRKTMKDMKLWEKRRKTENDA